MRRKRLGLWLYSMMLTLLSTLVILGIVLRPPEGWTPVLKETYHRWFGEKPLQVQPLTAPTPHESSYAIKAYWDEGKRLITAEETVTLPQLQLDGIPFYLYTPAGALQIRDVKLNGQAVKFDVNDSQLTVQAAPASGPQTVTLTFDVTVPESAKRFGIYKGVATMCYWYPVLAVERDGKWMPRPDSLGFGDPFLMDLGNYRIEWNAPAGYKWYGSGQKLSETAADGGRVVSVWQAEKVRNFALVGGRGFQEAAFETGYGTHVVVATVDPAKLAQTVELARSAVSTYSQDVGIDPNPVLTVLELPSGTIYAHELPNLALFSEDLWGYDDPQHWIAHEIGHVWFYNTVGNYEAETPWLDEGLADYLALIEMETRQGEGAYQNWIAEYWQRFKAGDTYSPYKPGTSAGVLNGQTAVPYGSYATSQAHYYYSYLRPILMYHDLRSQMGDEKFFKFLKQYYIKNAQKTATRADLEQALDDIDPAMVARMKLWLDTPNEQLISQVKAAFGG
ncbi:M1 family aminopeptidase [Tumebacillus flagellatus]|uniref:Peptidase M1 membrane alanine aminopeptidase domain-containing protein n=1 Tax=Tumebacillus flagellatus TaxID=1157490 RepID=A0A074MBU6_9BACL|nr:M1 family aminopeptidase [Tumebacillus flagellatus]KEO83377.1 hypothetical protein EL26_10395 [Tumebacillus flagellatus]